MNLYIVRHGETAFNKSKRLRSWIELPLNAEGRRQSEDTARLLQEKPIERIYTSDLLSAQETADIIGRRLGLIPFPRHNFRTLNFGKLNGKPMAEVERQMWNWVYRWQEDPAQRIATGDSFSMFQYRQLNGLHEAVAMGRDVCIVAHGRNCAWFKRYADRGSLAIYGEDVDLLMHPDQPTGSAAVYYYEPGRLIFLRYLLEGSYFKVA